MQRRAAAAYVALFVVIAAGSYAVMGAAEEPTISLDDPEISVSEGETFTVDGVEYNVTNISEPAQEEGGELEGGGDDNVPGAPVEANVTWDEEVHETETHSQGDAVAVNGTNWTVEIPDEEDPSSFRLVENNTVDRPTVEQDNTTYVIVERDGEQVLVERSEYVRQEFGEPETHEFNEGDAFLNESKTVDNVTADEVTLGLNATQEQLTTISESDEVTLQNTTYVAHFPDRSTLQLTTDLDAYQEGLEEQQRFRDRMTGFTYLTAISVLSALVLLGAAYMPRRR